MIPTFGLMTLPTLPIPCMIPLFFPVVGSKRKDSEYELEQISSLFRSDPLELSRESRLKSIEDSHALSMEKKCPFIASTYTKMISVNRLYFNCHSLDSKHADSPV